MVFIKESSDGQAFVCRKGIGMNKGRHGPHPYKDWYFVKYSHSHGSCGVVYLGTLILPKEHVGKRIRLKVEVIK